MSFSVIWYRCVSEEPYDSNTTVTHHPTLLEAFGSVIAQVGEAAMLHAMKELQYHVCWITDDFGFEVCEGWVS